MRTEGVSLRRRSCFRKEPRSPQGVDSTAAPRARGCLQAVLDRLRLNRPGTLSAGRRLNAKIMSTDVQHVAEAGRILIAKSGCLMFPQIRRRFARVPDGSMMDPNTEGGA